MSYVGFLIIYLLPPLGLLILLSVYDQRRGKAIPAEFNAIHPWKMILLMILIAVIYTTPWDNYLVATNVWWYDPRLVTGLVIGWVPIEEYVFFILQTALTGLLTITLARYLPLPKTHFLPKTPLRWLLSLSLLPLWILSILVIVTSWDAGTYLAILFIWAIPPIAMQLAFGADILWHFRRLVLLTILIPTLYLSFADSLAISTGTWTINPAKSLMFFVGSLPIEELIFFLTTNTLIVLGMTLACSKEGQTRFKTLFDQVMVKINALLKASSIQRGIAND